MLKTLILAIILSLVILSIPPVPTNPAVSDVAFPSAEVGFIIGPQISSGDVRNPSAWFDQNAFDKGLQFGADFPAAPPSKALAGTVALIQGSQQVSGSATQFTVDFPAPVNQFNFFVRDASGALQTYYLASVNSNTSLTLSQPWVQPTQSGRPYSTATGDETNDYLNRNYYDQAMAQYINYYRTGDVRFRDYARKIADSWWLAPFVDEGRASVNNIIAPRSISLNGLMLRALDGRPEMWPWIVNYTRVMFDIWIGQRMDYPALYFGAREGGYMLLYAANLGKVHPDLTVRTEFKDKALNAAVNLYARLQKTDGSWRWGDQAWIGDAMQPFHVGILLEGMVAVHLLTGNTAVRTSIIKGTEALYQVGFNPNQWDAMYYQVGGSWTDGTNCATGCGAASGTYPGTFGTVAEARQLNATCLHAFGYAFVLTGDAKFKTWGDEILEASFNAEQGFRLLAWFNQKNYDEAYRAGGRYLAWRLTGSPSPTPTVSPTPSPSPTATPTPTPTPTPVPSPTPTPSVLPVCRPSQVIGSPPTCRCTTKLVGPASARRCRP